MALDEIYPGSAFARRPQLDKMSTMVQGFASLSSRALIVAAVIIASGITAAQHSPQTASITIDYPAGKSIFPPEITPPLFLWRDSVETNTSWRIDVAFADGSAAIHLESKGERMIIGAIDERCVGSTNQLPKLTPQQAAAHTWTPDAATWAAIKKHSVTRPATVTITGLQAFSSGKVIIETSKDPVGAPIFYRDVPLMPSEVEKGVIKPLAPASIPLIAWRLRNVGEPQQPPDDGGAAHLRQLPLVLARRQDDGHGHGWPAERQGHVCAGPRLQTDVHPQRRRDRVEFFPRQAGRKDPGRLHVAGFAGRAVRRDHDQWIGGGPAVDSCRGGS